jgi:hypothetical protein
MTDCQLCAHANDHGWWGDSGVTHCRTCHATWNLGTRTTHCVSCHETFSTPGNCDAHQRPAKGEKGLHCRPPAQAGLEARENAHATRTWVRPDDRGWQEAPASPDPLTVTA